MFRECPYNRNREKLLSYICLKVICLLQKLINRKCRIHLNTLKIEARTTKSIDVRIINLFDSETHNTPRYFSYCLNYMCY